MERCRKICSIDVIIKMIAGTAFLRPILQKNGCDCENGFVLWLDSERSARNFGKAFSEHLNARYVGKIKRIHEVMNYEAAMYLVKGNEDVMGMKEFLEEERFLPILLIGKKFPADLKHDQYILRINIQESMEEIEKLGREFSDFTEYIVENIVEIEKIFENLNHLKAISEMRELDVDDEYIIIMKCMVAVGSAWKSFIQKNSNEDTAEKWFHYYLEICGRIIVKFDDYDSVYELNYEINSLIWEYVGSNPEVVISSAEKVTLNTLNALNQNKAILYDEKFYYVPEKLMKKIFNPLFESMSITELKEKLQSSGIIFCNEDGYTVKKKYWTVFGTSGRYRALKFGKKELISCDGMLLEDLYEENNNQEEGRDYVHRDDSFQTGSYDIEIFS